MFGLFKTLLFVFSLGPVWAQESMYGSLIYVDDQTIGAETTLRFLLNLPTAKLETGDYLTIDLP